MVNILGYKKSLNLLPAQMIVLGFAVLIFIGTSLFQMTFFFHEGQELSYTDALFMATSAITATGLCSVDVPSTFNLAGQIVLMIMIQIGGWGIMCFPFFIAMATKHKVGLKSRIMIRDSFSGISLSGVMLLMKRVMFISLGIELVGAICLFFVGLKHFDVPNSIWFGMFYSVSAFCHGGFDAMGIFTSLADDVFANVVFMFLIVSGSLGFVVLGDIADYPKNKKISLHSHMVLMMTGWLILIGAIFFFLFEMENPQTIGDLSFGHQVMASVFQSITTRSAGYATVPIGKLSSATLFLMMVLMFIGGAPGSTGGGVKITTFGLIVLDVIATFKGEDKVNFRKREIPKDIIRRSFAIVFLCLAIVLAISFLTCIFEDGVKYDFRNVEFEVISAACTVGLSAGLTTKLTAVTKIILSLLMFFGRVGSITLALALASRYHERSYRYPEGKIMIG